MSKKTKNELYGVINGSVVLIGLYFLVKNNIGIYFFIGWIIFSAIITGILISFIPNKNKRKKSKKTKSKSTVVKNDRRSNTIRSKEKLLSLPLDELNGFEFEEVCYLYYKDKKMKPRKTSAGADGGVDLIVHSKNDNADIAVQIKHHKNRITVKEIREIDSAKKNYGLALADIISSSGFTRDALIEADKRKVKTHSAFQIDKWRKEKFKSIR